MSWLGQWICRTVAEGTVPEWQCIACRFFSNGDIIRASLLCCTVRHLGKVDWSMQLVFNL